LGIIKENSLINYAIDFAMNIHLNQKRKVSGDPYFIHSFRTYQTAKTNGLTKEQQILAIIHDTYEDGNNKSWIAKQIKERFGEKMFRLVLLLSHNKEIRYNDYIYTLYNKSPLALEVKLCDMLDNLRDNPSPKQKDKYRNAIIFLLSKGVVVKGSLINKIKKILRIN